MATVPTLQSFRFEYPVVGDDALRSLLRTAFGVTLPDKQVCANHSTPWRAFTDAYHARSPAIVWKASRGFGGKTFSAGLLANAQAVGLGADTKILGGSGEQSARVLEVQHELWKYEDAPRFMLKSEPTVRKVRLRNGASIQALYASTTSARGAHPQRLIFDEVDEMKLLILDAALGQPQGHPRKTWIPPGIVLSSTHQYQDGTMSEILRRADEFKWPVHEWAVDAEAPVLTADGEVPLGQIAPGASVLTRSGWRRVRSVSIKGWRQTVRVGLNNGASVACTEDHRIALARGGWCRAGELSIGDAVLVSPGVDRQTFPAVAASVVDVGVAQAVAALAAPFRDLASDMWCAAHVFLVRNPFDVAWIDAATDAAGVIALQAPWSLPAENSRHDKVRERTTRGVVLIGDSVAESVDSASPEPAARTNDLDPSGDPRCVECRRSHDPGVLVPVPVAHVASISEGAIRRVGDLSIEGEHEFFAGGVLVHNCWRETVQPHGWLDPGQIAIKKKQVSTYMWNNEYELQEPSVEGRAFDTQALERAFHKEWGTFEGALGEPIEEAKLPKEWVFAHGADWAKLQDWTILVTLRCDVRPVRLVSFQRLGRGGWTYPMMIGEFNKRIERMPGQARHDRGGVGTVVHDELTQAAQGVNLQGATRVEVFSDYIVAIEKGRIAGPHIDYLVKEHRFCTRDDLFGSGHPPDSVVAMALAWRAARAMVRFDDDEGLPSPESIGTKRSYWRR